MPFRLLLFMPIGKTIYISWLCVLLWFDTVFLGLSNEQMAVAIIGAVSGSFVLQWFKGHTKNWTERLIRIISSAISGIFIGSAIIKYFNIEALQYIGAVYFLTSFVILIFLRALLSVSDSNAKVIVTKILRSFIKIDDSIVEKKTEIITKEINAPTKKTEERHGAIISDEVKPKSEDE